MNKFSIGLLAAVLMAVFAGAGVAADSKRPTCDERPDLRNCVKVEDPHAQPPAPSVYRQKKPALPVAKPAPAPAGSHPR
jgi:hypothetical protein